MNVNKTSFHYSKLKMYMQNILHYYGSFISELTGVMTLTRDTSRDELRKHVLLKTTKRRLHEQRLRRQIDRVKKRQQRRRKEREQEKNQEEDFFNGDLSDFELISNLTV